MAVQITHNSPARTHDDTRNKTSDPVGVQALEMQNKNGTPSESRPKDSDVQQRVEHFNEQLNNQSHNSVRGQSQQQPDYADESPELLRWRADNLLDEMMLGAVDVSAGDSTPVPTGAAENGSAGRNFRENSQGENGYGENGYSENGYSEKSQNNGYAAPSEMQPHPQEPSQTEYYADRSWNSPARPDEPSTEHTAATETNIWEETSWSTAAHGADERNVYDNSGTRDTENPRAETREPQSVNPAEQAQERHSTGRREFDSPRANESDRVIPSPSSPTSSPHSSPANASTAPRGDGRSIGGQQGDSQQASRRSAGGGYSNGHVVSTDSPAGEAVQGQERAQPDSHRGNRTHTSASNGTFTPSFVAAPFPTAGSVPAPAPRTEGASPPTAEPHRAAQPHNTGNTDDTASYLHPPAAVESQLRRPAATAPNGTHEGTGAPEQDQPGNPTHPRAEERPAQRPDQILNEYITSQAYQREQERKQWSIMSGRSNDYPASVPRGTAYPDSAAAHPYGVTERPNGSAANPAHYNQQAMPFADAMAVGPQARRRTNTLPRQSMPDMDALREEIFALQEQVETALPLGRDTADRARHLVEKAHSILGFGVERAAEVSYYIQQVRAILQRVEQRVYWSNIYRRRLRAYLVSWLLLSVILLLSCLLYSSQLQMVAATIFGLSPSSLVPLNFAPFLFAFAAGAAGSSAAALVNMWRHGQKEYGFFDRKYGMLGIVLPLIGVLVGSLLFVVISSLYALFGLTAAGGWSFGAVPALLAFVFGCVQEHIYGTSD